MAANPTERIHSHVGKRGDRSIIDLFWHEFTMNLFYKELIVFAHQLILARKVYQLVIIGLLFFLILNLKTVIKIS